jgi:hypothetical protein
MTNPIHVWLPWRQPPGTFSFKNQSCLWHSCLVAALITILRVAQLEGQGQENATLVGIDDKTFWHYDISGADLGTAWKEKSFDDPDAF